MAEWLGAFSYDVAPQSRHRSSIIAAVTAAAGPRKNWRQLSRLWLLRFASLDDFKAFTARLERLYNQRRGEFEYFALLFNPKGGRVLMAPDPGVRLPEPVPALGGGSPFHEALPAGSKSSTAELSEEVLTHLEDQRAFSDLLREAWVVATDIGRPRPVRAAGGTRRKRGTRKKPTGRR